MNREFYPTADVIIVGAGLSGLMLRKELTRRGVSTITIDEREEHHPKQAMYLTTQDTALAWGPEVTQAFTSKRKRSGLISGYTIYDRNGTIQQELPPNTDNSYGFATLPQTVMQKSLDCKNAPPVAYGTACQRTEISDLEVTVFTNKGTFHAPLVIDATGWRGSVVHPALEQTNDAYVIGLYGGNYPTQGFNPRNLAFIKGLEHNHNNWVMPLSQTGAEVVAGDKIPVTDLNDWWNKHAEQALAEIVAWYKERQQTIYVEKTEPHAMAFRVDLAKKTLFKSRVVPFGESAGLNSPLVGQLIDTLPYYTNNFADQIAQAKEQNDWSSVGKNFHSFVLNHPPFLYLTHTLMRENRGKEVNGIATNRAISQAIIETFDQQAVLNIVQGNGLAPEQVVTLLKKKPLAVMSYILHSTPALSSLLLKRPDLFAQAFLSCKNRLIKKLSTRA